MSPFLLRFMANQPAGAPQDPGPRPTGPMALHVQIIGILRQEGPMSLGALVELFPDIPSGRLDATLFDMQSLEVVMSVNVEGETRWRAIDVGLGASDQERGEVARGC
ncbi:MAG: hypothetical protein AAGA48_28615 [Myxococcota bacterium]